MARMVATAYMWLLGDVIIACMANLYGEDGNGEDGDILDGGDGNDSSGEFQVMTI